MNSTIRILTYNVFLRPPPIKTNEDDFKQQRFRELMNVIDEYDVVCFQEMFQTASFRPERIIQAAIKKKFYYWKLSEPPAFGPGPVVDSGLVVLSKYPIIYSHFQSYQIGILSDSASDKGYIYCKIRAEDSIIHLFATHLQASYKLQGMHLERELSVKTRLYQFNLLLNRIKDHLREQKRKEDELVILVGDLNVDSNEQPYKMTQTSYLKHLPVLNKLKADEQEMVAILNIPTEEYFSQYPEIVYLFKKHGMVAQDHGLIKFGGHPVTFGEEETVLTGIEDFNSKQSLDYIFSIGLGDKVGGTKWRCQTETCSIEKFKVEGQKFVQLSDHYGVSIKIAR